MPRHCQEWLEGQLSRDLKVCFAAWPPIATPLLREGYEALGQTGLGKRDTCEIVRLEAIANNIAFM